MCLQTASLASIRCSR